MRMGMGKGLGLGLGVGMEIALEVWVESWEASLILFLHFVSCIYVLQYSQAWILQHGYIFNIF